MPEKIHLLIDTNSLVHLGKVPLLNGTTAEQLLFDTFHVYNIDQISKEYERNIKKEKRFNQSYPEKKKHSFRKERLRKFKKNSTNLSVRQINSIEATIIAHYYKKPLGEDDRGERHLIASAIGGVYQRTFNFCIILTDDYTAFKNFLENVKEDFKFGDVWNVFDVILHMFLCKKSISIEAANNAIRTLAALSSISIKYFAQKKSGTMTPEEARAKMGLFYSDKLERNNSLRRIL